ncbi:hypothetical protein DIPPA_32714 [Diplonema papillatum]|nr:hypothetical protein DIPPA_32714 [Diplonema papillatum]|eukprot:gene17124-26284_t
MDHVDTFEALKGETAVAGRQWPTTWPNGKFGEMSFKHVQEIAIRWCDVNAFRHVNSVVFPKWLEVARVSMLEQFVSSAASKPPASPSLIVSGLNIKYLHELSYPDTAILVSNITDVKESSFLVNTKGVSKRTGAVAFVAACQLTLLDSNAEKHVRIPEPMLGVVDRFACRSHLQARM